VKFRLEATPGELHEKGEALVEELAKAFSGTNPELSDALDGILPPPSVELRHPVLKGLKKRTDKEYDAMLKRMLKDIGKVLDQSIFGTSSGVLSKGEKIPGGLAAGKSPEDYDSKALAAGIKVELEHTSDRKVAQEIAMDHLEEDPKYYEKLARMEGEDSTKKSFGVSPPEKDEEEEPELGTGEEEEELEPGDYDPKTDEIVPEPEEEEESEEKSA